jgi:hypothetical protein
LVNLDPLSDRTRSTATPRTNQATALRSTETAVSLVSSSRISAQAGLQQAVPPDPHVDSAEAAAGIGSQPMKIENAVAKAIVEMLKQAPITLRGPELRKLRLDHPNLASPAPAGNPSANPIAEPTQHCPHCGR